MWSVGAGRCPRPRSLVLRKSLPFGGEVPQCSHWGGGVFPRHDEGQDGANPSVASGGAKPISFSGEKETVLDAKENAWAYALTDVSTDRRVA